MKYLFSDDKREMDFVRSIIARAFKSNKPFNLDGIGKITKSGSEYSFFPDKKLQQLLEIAEQYPEPIVPINSSTKLLYGIDTIDDGGWCLLDFGVCWTQYLQYVNGALVFLKDEEVSDEWDDEKKGSVPDDAPRFNKKTAKRCPLVCMDTKWSIKKAELKNQDDKHYINSFLEESKIDFDKIIHQVMSDVYKGIIKYANNELHVLFIKKMNCSLDAKSKLIRFEVYMVLPFVF